MHYNIPFSVLIPVYYKENPLFLDQALCSIVTQSLMPAEILVVEDGPLTPQLREVIQTYISAHSGLFNVISLEKNKGMGYAMDIGLRACKYELVARMDTDDIARNDRFEKQISFLLQHPDIDVIGSYIEEFVNMPGDLKRYRKVSVTHQQITSFARKRSPINHMTVIFKRSKALQAGSYWSRKALEDYHLWYQMIKKGNKFHNIPEVLMYTRVGNDMEKRRRGQDYFKHELFLFQLMRSDRFINTFEFCSVVLARFIIRILPTSLLKVVYDRVLRQHSK